MYLGEKGKLVDILDPNKKGCPLNLLLEEIKLENKKLREEIIKKTAIEDIVSRTTLKGYDFEDQCYEMLCEIAKRETSGDIVEKIGTDPSHVLFKSKKGDFSIALGENPSLRITVEAKNFQSQISFPTIENTLTRAMKAREAQYAILVVKERESLPRFVGYFKEFGNMLICALGKKDTNQQNFEILDIAYKWAKMQVLLRETKVTPKIDGVKLGDKLSSIKSLLTQFQNILAQCDNIEGATGKIREECGKLKSKLAQQIDDVTNSI